MHDIYKILDDLQISYEKYDHPAVFTVAEAALYDRGIDAGKSKNLFLRNVKGDTHYLVVMQADKRLDLQRLATLLNESKLSFASEERLVKYLGLTPGSVSPFGLINNADKSVNVIVDNDLLTYEKLAYHPNINTATLTIATEDLKKFLEWTENKVLYLHL
jgi:Ala-tRNA(Pro) deacylase